MRADAMIIIISIPVLLFCYDRQGVTTMIF